MVAVARIHSSLIKQYQFFTLMRLLIDTSITHRAPAIQVANFIAHKSAAPDAAGQLIMDETFCAPWRRQLVRRSGGRKWRLWLAQNGTLAGEIMLSVVRRKLASGRRGHCGEPAKSGPTLGGRARLAPADNE